MLENLMAALKVVSLVVDSVDMMETSWVLKRAEDLAVHSGVRWAVHSASSMAELTVMHLEKKSVDLTGLASAAT